MSAITPRGATRATAKAGALPPRMTDAAADEGDDPKLPPLRRLRLVACCAVLVGLVMVQDAGLLVSDTKFDLVQAPGDFLSRALHLWDGEGAFGQVQNQAYGYLWPMGPFFWVGDLLGAPGWVVQRCWQAMVLCVAFVGCARVARALGIRSEFACLVAAAAYALSPRVLSTLGPISIEAWPTALAPWVLLPLVLGSSRGSPRRAAALSALAVGMVGGVNATATFAVIPLGALWLLTRERGPRRRQLMTWWPLFTLLATLWWLLPLLLLGAYSPPFLDYIETGAITTFPTTLYDVLRGTSSWVPYVDPTRRAGHDLISDGYLALNSGVVLLVGFVGLLDRRNPHRLFLVVGLALGVLALTAGHMGSMSGWGADDVRSLLDGALAPLRNVHKFDPLVRLPLVLGLAFALDGVVESVAGARPRFEQVAFAGLVLLAVVGSAAPVLTSRVEPAGAMPAVPDYWTETADWLADNSNGGTDLVVPGSEFGVYSWGAPKDEPMQWLAGSRWAVRSVIPLSPPGNIRMLDAVETRLAEGVGSRAFTEYLRRAGIDHLVVRNDLPRGSDAPDPTTVRAVLEGSPGISLVASFGPLVGGQAHVETPEARVVVNAGRQSLRRSVEVYAVGGTAAATAPDASVVAGGPEDVLDLLETGLIDDDEPALLASDVQDDAEITARDRVLLTDGLRDRERQYPRVHDGYGPTRGPGDERRTTNPEADYRLPGDAAWRTRVRLTGAESIAASSSASDADATGGARPGELPYAALDDDPDTAWVSETTRTAAPGGDSTSGVRCRPRWP